MFQFIASSTLECLIPHPFAVTPVKGGGKLAVAQLRTLSLAAKFAFLKPHFAELASYVKLPLKKAASAGDIAFVVDKALAPEAYRLAVGEAGIEVAAADAAGAFYGFSALSQMLNAAMAGDAEPMALDCGTVEDHPRFSYRGFMLDSARHFQSVAAIKRLLRLMAHYRLNVFHWHLTDNQSYRAPSAGAPELNTFATLEAGNYSAADIADIVAYAESLFIEVVPELDMPGHSSGLLALHPELACPGAKAPAREYCLGSKETRAFLKKRIEEFVALFPASRYIHLGGDEAATANWDQCPRCRAALKKLKASSIRDLEAEFMAEMCNFVTSLGRTPMTWCTSSLFPAGTLVQAWQTIEDSLHTFAAGNPMVYSIHRNFYFDYQQNADEPHWDWMINLSEEDVYDSAPFDGWTDAKPGQFAGVEACLWTERIPERRLMQKIVPRLAAFAECAWSMPWHKNHTGFLARKRRLADAVADGFFQS